MPYNQSGNIHLANNHTCPAVFATLLHDALLPTRDGIAMPFLEGDGPVRPAGPGLQKVTLAVQPDKILLLIRRLEDCRDKIVKFMRAERDNLRRLPPPGADPCSLRAVRSLSHNGQQALDATAGFVDELTNVINALHESARVYGLVEDANTDKFRQVPR